jgi:hypothetical protein
MILVHLFGLHQGFIPDPQVRKQQSAIFPNRFRIIFHLEAEIQGVERGLAHPTPSGAEAVDQPRGPTKPLQLQIS